MTVIFQTGYSLPGSDQPLTHARIAHSLNWLSGGTATASSTATGFDADAPLNTLTYERWKPTSASATWEYDHGSAAECDYACIAAHTMGTNGNTLQIQWAGASRTNLLTYSEQFDQWGDSGPEITVTANSTAAPDGNTTADTLEKTSGTFEYLTRLGTTTSGLTYTGSVYLKQGTATGTRLALFNAAISGSPLEVLIIDWANPDATGEAVGGGWYRFSLTAAAVDAGINLLIYPSGISVNTGTVYAWGAQLEQGPVATDYIKTEAATASSVWHSVAGYTAITTDEPIMAIFGAQTRQRWRISISGGTAPEIGVVKFGSALQMERPIYGGHSPITLARQTILRSNYSETGEYLGRTKQRTYLATSFDWNNLTAAWVRSNWPSFQKAIEAEPFWVAWRPATFGEVGFCQVDEVPIPQNIGTRDLMSVSMTVRARGYD